MDPAQDAPAGPGGVGSGPVPGAGAIATAPRAHVRPCADVAAPVTPATNGAATTASSPAVNASPSHDALQCVKPAHVAAVSPDSPVTVFAGVGEVTARRLGEVGVRRVLDLAALADPAVADVAGHAKVRNLDDMVAAARAVCGSPAAAHAGGAARALVVGTGTGDASLPDVARLSLAESTPGGASPNGSVGTRSGVSPASRGAPGARARPSQARPPRSQRLKLQMVEVLWGVSGEPVIIDPGRTDDVSRAYVDIDYGTRRVHLHLVGAADEDTDGGGGGTPGTGSGAPRTDGGCTVSFRDLASLDVLDDTLQLGVKYGAKAKVPFARPVRPGATTMGRRSGSGSGKGRRAGGGGSGSGKAGSRGTGKSAAKGGTPKTGTPKSGAGGSTGGGGGGGSGPKKSNSGGGGGSGKGGGSGRKGGSGGKKGRGGRKGTGAGKLDLRGRVLALRFKTQKKCKEVATRIRAALPKLRGAGFKGEGPMRCTYSLRGWRTLGRGANARVVVATVVRVPAPGDPPTSDDDDSPSSSSESGSDTGYGASGSAPSTPATRSLGSPHSAGAASGASGAGGSASGPYFATPTGRSATPTMGGAAAAMGRMLEGVKRGHEAGASPDSPVSILKGLGRVSVESLSRFGVRRVLDLARLDSREVQDLASKAKVKGLLPAATSARLVCNATGKSLQEESRRRSSSQSGGSGMVRGGSGNSATTAGSRASSRPGGSPTPFSADAATARAVPPAAATAAAAAPGQSSDARVPAALSGTAARGSDPRALGLTLGHNASARDGRAPGMLLGASFKSHDARAPPALSAAAVRGASSAPPPPVASAAAHGGAAAGAGVATAVAPPNVPPTRNDGAGANAAGAAAAGAAAAGAGAGAGGDGDSDALAASRAAAAAAAHQADADAARSAAAAAAHAALASAVTLPAPPRASVTLGTKVAVKMFDKFTPSRAKVELTSVRAEAALQMRFSHPNLVQVLDVAEDSSRFYIVMERLNGGELFAMLEQRAMEGSAFSEYEACMVLSQVASALSVLHELNIAHRDVKPENVMLRTPYRLDDVVLVDFGESKELNSRGRARTLRGSLGYMAPEISTGAGHYSGRAADVFSLGVTLFCMLCAKPPFGWDQSYDQVDATGPLWEDLSPECHDLVLSMLTRDASKRPTVAQVLEHPWLELAVASDGDDGGDGDGSEYDGSGDEDEDEDEDDVDVDAL